MLVDFAVSFGCIVVIRVEIWFGWVSSYVGWKRTILPWALTWVWVLNGQSGEGVVTPAPSEAREAKWVSSPEMIPSEAGMAPTEDP